MVRYAASSVVIDGVIFHNYVVELHDDTLLRSYKLEAELAQAQWVRRIEIVDGKLTKIVRV